MTILDARAIQEFLPHRYPFLLLDRVVELEEERIVAIKNVTGADPLLASLIVEAIAQAAGVLVLKRIPDRRNKVAFPASVENAKFRRPVVPSDELRIEVQLLKWKSYAARIIGRCTVNGRRVAEATLMCTLTESVIKTETSNRVG